MEKLLKLLEEICPDVDFRNCESLVNDGLLDSLDIVTIVTEINYEFGINITAAEVLPENFNSAQAIHRLILKLSEKDS